MISSLHTFHDGAVLAADGTDMDVAGLHTVAIQISGTSTARQIDFLASIDRTNFVSFMGMDMATLSPVTTTTETAKIFILDVRGIELIRMDLVSVSGGTVSIIGRSLGQ